MCNSLKALITLRNASTHLFTEAFKETNILDFASLSMNILKVPKEKRFQRFRPVIRIETLLFPDMSFISVDSI